MRFNTQFQQQRQNDSGAQQNTWRLAAMVAVTSRAILLLLVFSATKHAITENVRLLPLNIKSMCSGGSRKGNGTPNHCNILLPIGSAAGCGERRTFPAHLSVSLVPTNALGGLYVGCRPCPAAKACLRYCPVNDSAHPATCSGVPQATSLPPPSPPSGPMSTT